MMIDKEMAKQKGINIIDTQAQENPLLQMLKKHFPQTIKDNQINLKSLALALGLNENLANMQGYELTFTGKGLANALYSTPVQKELKFESTQSHKNEDSKNFIIRGDNLDVLKLLKAGYNEKIKMIYIDPPYNTKNDNFIYPDNFREDYTNILKEVGLLEFDEEKEEWRESETLSFFAHITATRSHSAWLAFMLPRLKLARDLLREDGVIFISIDDNEQANLKILCDEIFGEENCVYQLSVVDKLNGNDNSSGMMETQEYCLIYAKNKDYFEVGVLPLNEDSSDEWKQDELGWWKEGGSLKATGEAAHREARPNLFFPIYIDEKNLTFSLERDTTHTYELYPLTNNKEMRWYWAKNKFLEDSNEVIIKKTKEGYALYKKQRPALGDIPSKRGKTTFYSPKYSTANSDKEITKIFGAKVFAYTKSKDLIKDFISLANLKNNEQESELILDFFAGSGTTAQAVMELNAEDNGNRSFILVQLDEVVSEVKSKSAYDFCKNTLHSTTPVISDITIERVKRVGEKISTENKDKILDLGFKVYSLCDKPQIITDRKGHLKLEGKSFLTPQDKATNLALQSGKTLDKDLMSIVENKLYKCEDSYYVISCDEKVLEVLRETQNEYIFIDGYADITLQDFLNFQSFAKERLKVIY